MRKLDKTVAVGMSREMYDEIKRLAKEGQRSIPGYIRFVLRNYMKEESANQMPNNFQSSKHTNPTDFKEGSLCPTKPTPFSTARPGKT